MRSERVIVEAPQACRTRSCEAEVMAVRGLVAQSLGELSAEVGNSYSSCISMIRMAPTSVMPSSRRPLMRSMWWIPQPAVAPLATRRASRCHSSAISVQPAKECRLDAEHVGNLTDGV